MAPGGTRSWCLEGTAMDPLKPTPEPVRTLLVMLLFIHLVASSQAWASASPAQRPKAPLLQLYFSQDAGPHGITANALSIAPWRMCNKGAVQAY